MLAKAMAVRDLMALNHSPFIHPSHCFANLLITESSVNVAVHEVYSSLATMHLL